MSESCGHSRFASVSAAGNDKFVFRFSGKMVSMKHLKSEVKSIKTNVECGLMFDDPTVRFQQDDLILCVRKFKVNQKTAWNPRGF